MDEKVAFATAQNQTQNKEGCLTNENILLVCNAGMSTSFLVEK